LAAVTLILKACDKYNEGDFRANSGYLYISIIYNVSICLSLYCLGMFWVCVNDDLKPFRPVPKFLCVKGILFFSFWQSILISTLVAAKVIVKLGPYVDPEHVSTGINNLVTCAEMPLFAFAHMFAFSYRDFIDPQHTYVGRMPVYYAFRDAFGLKDVVEDGKAILRGEGMDYREFEPAEGLMHQGEGRFRRIKAGLRYSKGGKTKYWLPKLQDPDPHGRGQHILDRAIAKVAGEDQTENLDHAPLLQSQEDDVVHLAPDMMEEQNQELSVWDTNQVDDGYELPFGDVDEADDELFEHSKQYLFGDYNYPCLDVSSESARMSMWDEEERVLSNERGAWFSPLRGGKGQEVLQNRDRPVWQGYGAVENHDQPRQGGAHQIRKGGAQRVIDLGSDRAAASSPTDKGAVHLRWAKGSQDPSTSKPSPRVSPPLQRAESSSSSGSSGKARLLKSPPTVLSRSNSRHSGPQTPLPPDAVDLVVEDPEAAEEEIARERRKGEPAAKLPPGLKKVYRKGFETDVPEGEEEQGEHKDGKIRGEVEVEEPTRHHDGRRVDAGEQIIHNIERDGSPGDVDVDSDGGKDAGRSRSPWDDEPTVVTVTTPPLNARINAYNFDDHSVQDDGNPWA
jgi:Organic solute transporter Ostalpha